MKHLVLMCGVPGAGKSTYCRANLTDYTVCSADDYFTDAAGVYNFNVEKLGAAHMACQNKFLGLVDAGFPIVVDNTNTNLRDIRIYLDHAFRNGYTVEIVHLDVDPEVACARGLHGVPLEATRKMAARIVTLRDNLAREYPMVKVTHVR